LDFKKKGKTIILVTHSINEVEKLCDKALLLHEGEARKFGKPKEVIETYTELAKQREQNN